MAQTPTWTVTPVSYTSLTTNSTTDDYTLSSALPKSTVICGITINPQTVFSSSGFTITSLTAQVGASDATNNSDPNRIAFAPPFSLLAAGYPNFEMISEAKSTTNANSWSLVVRFILNGGTGTHTFGNGSTTNLSAGSVNIGWCTVTGL